MAATAAFLGVDPPARFAKLLAHLLDEAGQSMARDPAPLDTTLGKLEEGLVDERRGAGPIQADQRAQQAWARSQALS